MGFVFPVLLGGLALTAIPVLLHLIMRQKPRTLPFPAFRFLVQRHRTNLRKLRLRHLFLLALRILLIAAICLALTRPRLFHQGLGLSSERPVAAVLIIDTSPSMDYKTSDGVTRLDEAKRRALEFLDELPEGSQIVVLDTAAIAQSARGDWTGKSHARERIGGLKVGSLATPVSASLETAYRLLADLARRKDDGTSRFLPRFVCVFSDRTRAAWDIGRQANVWDASDGVPSALEGLHQARDNIGPLMDRLKELRAQIPLPPGKDYPDQALLDFLEQLRDRLPAVTKDDMPPDEKLAELVMNLQRRGRDLLSLLPKDDLAPAVEEYRGKLAKSLQDVLGNLRGAQGLFFDVGVESPVDLALVQLDPPRIPSGQVRQLFAEDEKFLLHAIVRATGRDFSTTLMCKVEKKTLQQAVEIKAGETKTIPFEIDLAELKLGAGQHQLEARFATPDLLAFDNQRFLTFAVREARRVLVLADNQNSAVFFVNALKALRFSVDVKTPANLPGLDVLAGYQAVYLFGLAAPDATLWGQLASYVQKGGGLGIVPGGREMQLNSYHTAPAQKLVPGTFGESIAQGKDLVRPGAAWNLRDDGIYQHPLLAPIRVYKDDSSIDFIKRPCSAFLFWEVVPRKNEGAVLVRYDDAKKSSALLERRWTEEDGKAGKVVLFTTPLDARKPRWNDYLETDRSFYVAIAGYCTNYLVGDTAAVLLNFLTGQGEPMVTLPLNRPNALELQGPGVLELITASDGNRVGFKQAGTPGNYAIYGAQTDAKGSPRLAAYSVNIPGEESDLSRIPAQEIEAVFGPDSVLANDRKVDIRTLLSGHWSEPLELFPILMVLLLLILAVENLLSNKFYRRDNLEEERSVANG
ncbi:MAG: BatA domain-containing protein [Planctomycetes bacterium]|nr:BatA domain-containing protein [Planctomycetota bacterium]